MQPENSTQKVRERIYIGGLNPPRLSARDILRRLKSLDRIQIESSSVAENEDDGSDSEYFESGSKPYLHVTAISNDESVTALSILHQHYHNVKWKGCKLVVESAKPHFLERLAQERRDQETKKAEREAESTKVVQETQTQDLEETSRIPRRLRVRKKFGDTAVHIDTKPWTVETWSRFNKALAKLKQREEKHQANVLDESIPSSTPLMHRAVHIRFETDGISLTNLGGRDRSKENPNHVGGMISSSESSSSSSSSSSESESDSESLDESITDNKKEASTKPKPEKYEWSDDDSDSDSDKDNSEPPSASASKQQNKAGISRTNETYHWSTDDDSEEGQENTDSSSPSKDKRQLKPHSGTQEFAAGFDDSTSFSYDQNKWAEDDDDFDHLHRGENESADNDLVGDVASNLNILSSIFPEMANTRPVKPDIEANSKKESDSKASVDDKTKKPNLGFMPRFDPSSKSSEKYIVEDEDKKENQGSDSAGKEEKSDYDSDDSDDSNDSDDNDDQKAENDTRQKLPNVSTVYEQDKLEDVFRDARDAWKQDDNHAATGSGKSDSNAATTDKSSSFSFGFNLGDDNRSDGNKEKAQESTSATIGFSFGFNLPEQESKDEKATPMIQVDSTLEQRDSNIAPAGPAISSANDSTADLASDDDENKPDPAVERQKGLTLPDQDLQKYVDNFFGCNDGIRIMQNPQEFMNDEKERAKWNNERQTLTLDWKRKRKYAITRIQKRMKVRRR